MLDIQPLSRLQPGPWAFFSELRLLSRGRWPLRLHFSYAFSCFSWLLLAHCKYFFSSIHIEITCIIRTQRLNTVPIYIRIHIHAYTCIQLTSHSDFWEIRQHRIRDIVISRASIATTVWVEGEGYWESASHLCVCVCVCVCVCAGAILDGAAHAAQNALQI